MSRAGLSGRVVWVATAVALFGVGLLAWSAFTRGGFGSSMTGVITGVAYTVALASFLLSGAVIVSRQPRNVIGWLLVIPGLSIPGSELALNWLQVMSPPQTVGFWTWLALWFTSWAWVLLIFPIFHLLLTFPNGRFISPRWRWAGWLEGVMVSTMVLFATFGAELQVMSGDEVFWTVANPVGFIPSWIFEESGWFDRIWTPLLLLVTLTSVAAFLARFRVSSREQREQLKWPLAAVGVFGLVYAVTAVFTESGFAQSGWGDFLFAMSLAVIPVSVAIAVLKHRLYEIDRIISRTIGYLLVVGLLAGVFFTVVTAASTLLPSESDLVIAASTLAVAALFNPVRRRVQTWVEHRFNRSRYDAQQVMDRFAGSLQGRVDTTEVVEGWVGVVSETMHPASVAVWLRSLG